MKYGRLFRSYMRDYDHNPSSNRCTTLPYKELKLMAKNMYMDVKETANLYGDNNPLTNYQRMNHPELALAVYDALNTIY